MRQCLCTYFSSERSALLQEVFSAYHSPVGPCSIQQQASSPGRLNGLLVPHGAACDSFHIASHGYHALSRHLSSRGTTHLMAVLLGTAHMGTSDPRAPVVTSRQAWQTPLGVVPVDQAAVDWLSATHGIPVDEAAHAKEHSIENQLPFLQHAAMRGWQDVCKSPSYGDPAFSAAPAAPAPAAAAGAGAAASAHLTIVPILVATLADAADAAHYGGAIAGLLRHLEAEYGVADPAATAAANARAQQAAAPAAPVPPTPAAAPAAVPPRSANAPAGAMHGAGSSTEVVLIASSDLTHAGPWYRDLPPPGVSLGDYMRAKDGPVLQALMTGDAAKLIQTATAIRSSMCGLHAWAVALDACRQLCPRSKQCIRPQLLAYAPAHEIFFRPNSTGFAALELQQT